MYERNIDILCITETWLNSYTPDKYVNIQGYTLFRNDKGRGAGACIYVKDLLTSNLINITNNAAIAPDGIEDLWITVQHKKLPSIIVGCIYRHPKATQDTFNYLLDIFRNMISRNKSLYILGDLNDNLLAENKLSKIIEKTKLHQIIEQPTRITPHSSTLLDVIITNNRDSIIYSDVVPQVVSDHDLIHASINLAKPKRVAVTKTLRQMNTYTRDIFCDLLSRETHNLNRIIMTDDVDKQVETFTSIFNECLNACAPYVTKKRKRPAAPWITDSIRQAISSRNIAQQQLKDNRHNIDLQIKYKTEKKLVKSMLYKAKTNYYKEKLCECRGNTANTWKLIKEVVPDKKSSHYHCFDNKKEKAEEFNKHFANVGKIIYEKTRICNPSERTTEYTMTIQPTDSTYFRPEPVDIDSVILIIKHLNDTKSIGADKIPLSFLRDSLSITAFYLTCIVNTSIVTGKFPTMWKQAVVVPLLKGGDPQNVQNYRPISLLSVVSKILEKIIARQLTFYLESKSLLSTNQHGFRPKLSTETALTTVTNQIYNNMDNRKISLLTLCDLSKAFDSVDHMYLLNKCSNLKIDTEWLTSYLKKRTQSVRIDDTTSSKENVNYGVPQGSILGPILFNIYVNDLSLFVNDCLIVQYADDTQLLHSGTIDDLAGLVNRAETSLSSIKSYFNTNGLLLNSNKTQCIFIGNKQLLKRIPQTTVIKLDESSITPSNNVKNLGIYMDNSMSFEKHVNELNKKVTGVLMYINRVKDNFDKTSRILIVQALALSSINYCLRIWGTTNNTLLHNVQKLQNFAAKIAVGGLTKRDHVTPAFQELKWLTMKNKVIFDTAITVFKAMHNQLPEWFLNFPTVGDTGSERTRQNTQLHVPRFHTDTGARCLGVLGPRVWNGLPSHVKQTSSLTVFKNRLNNYFTDNRP